MPRTKLREAREAKDLTQAELAERIGAERRGVCAWETGAQRPYPHYRRRVREVLENQDKDLFALDGELSDEEQDLQPCHTETNRDTVDSSGPLPFIAQGRVRELRDFMEFVRRQFMEYLAKIGATALFGNISLALVSSPTIDPEEYLALCNASIGTWWEWFNQGNFNQLEDVLHVNVPILKRLANIISPFQCIAASLAARTKFMQMLLVTHKNNFAWREILCAEAVHFGKLSDNSAILATALDWQGNTYTLCYHQPQTAIPILNDALSTLKSESRLIKSRIYSNLSIAYAQEGYGMEAIKYVEMAISAMPKHPELDPFYQDIQFGQSELDQLVGKTYLYLAEYFPNSSYAQLAYDIFEQSISKPAMNQDSLSGSLIKKAEAARALGNLDEFVKCLTRGFLIGVEIDSIRRLCEANDAMGGIPDAWQKETSVQELQKDLSQAIVLARR